MKHLSGWLLVVATVACSATTALPPTEGIPDALRGRGVTIDEGMDGEVAWRVGLVTKEDKRSCLWLEGWRTQSTNICAWIAGKADVDDATLPGQPPYGPVICSYMINAAPSARVRDPIQGQAWLMVMCSRKVIRIELDEGRAGTYQLERSDDPDVSTIVIQIPPRRMTLTAFDSDNRVIDELDLDAVAAAAGPAATRIDPGRTGTQ